MWTAWSEYTMTKLSVTWFVYLVHVDFFNTGKTGILYLTLCLIPVQSTLFTFALKIILNYFSTRNKTVSNITQFQSMCRTHMLPTRKPSFYLCFYTSNIVCITTTGMCKLRHARYHQQKQQNPAIRPPALQPDKCHNNPYLSEVSLISPCGSQKDTTWFCKPEYLMLYMKKNVIFASHQEQFSG